MRLLITGADMPLGALAARALAGRHDLRLTGRSLLADAPSGYATADLRDPEQAAPLVEGREAVLHLAPHARPRTPDVASEKEALDWAARGTFVLLHAALKTGVRRVILASRLELMAAYPERWVVDETWRPLPAAEAAALAPWLAELTLREFVRAEPLLGICLRFGELGSGPADTTPEDAVAALERALEMDPGERKYRWWLFHIPSGERFRLAAAAQPPFAFSRGRREG